MFAIKNVPKQQTGVWNVEKLELKHIAPGNIIAHIHTRPRNVPDVDILKNKWRGMFYNAKTDIFISCFFMYYCM